MLFLFFIVPCTTKKRLKTLSRFSSFCIFYSVNMQMCFVAILEKFITILSLSYHHHWKIDHDDIWVGKFSVSCANDNNNNKMYKMKCFGIKLDSKCNLIITIIIATAKLPHQFYLSLWTSNKSTWKAMKVVTFLAILSFILRAVRQRNYFRELMLMGSNKTSFFRYFHLDLGVRIVSTDKDCRKYTQ